MKRAIWRWLWMLIASLVCIAGCNTSRYGQRHDQCLPGIQRVGVLVSSVKVYSLHTGGVQEERPDLEPAVKEKAIAAVQEEVRRCKRDPVLLDAPIITTHPTDNTYVGELALLNAVSESIMTHHYLYGKQRMIDYITGEASKTLARDDLDALLCVVVQGTIPTSGREGLKATAIVMGVLTGIHVHVQTKQAIVTLMLLERKTGEVLWFNTAVKEIKVDKDRDFRAMFKEACAYLLKPSK